MPRLPPQGGLAVVGAVGAAVEIACDESGFSGRNLLDPATPVITHASVDLTRDEAAAVLAGLGDGSPEEVKSGRFLRGPSAAVDRFLGALAGRAHVHRIDKELFLATRVVDLFLAEPTYAAGTRLTAAQRPAALALHRSGSRALLAAFLDVVPTKRGRRVDPAALDRFLRAGSAVGLDRARVEAVLERITAGDPTVPPPLEPVLPALAETVLHWSAGGRRVLVTHDEQSALTAGRLRELQRVLTTDGFSPLAGVLMVDSRDDPRVQVADLLAGVARRLPALGPVTTTALG